MSNVNKPLVSVITPSWNSAAYIEQTILSVINQSYKNVEYIIVDGGSTDGTLDIIRKYESSIDYWISEPDDGMYQAINKGMKLASGEIVAYLNSDDLYFPNTISRIVELFNANNDVDLIYGDLDFINACGERIYTQKYPEYDWTRFASSRYAMIGQPSAFWRKTLLDRIGLFDESMRMAADFDFFIRAGCLGKPKHVGEVFATFRTHPNSLTSNQMVLSLDEVRRIRAKYLAPGKTYYVQSIISDVFFKLLNWDMLIAKLALKIKRKR